MSQPHTYIKCRNFDSIYCPYRKDELMKNFIMNTTVLESSVPIARDFSKREEINKLCSSCDKFTPRKKS